MRRNKTLKQIRISRALKAHYNKIKDARNRKAGTQIHHWHKIKYFGKKLSGDDKKTINLRKQALKLYNVKISAVPKINQLRRLYRKMRDKRNAMKARIKKEQYQIYDNRLSHKQMDNVKQYADDFYNDSEEGAFQREIDT